MTLPEELRQASRYTALDHHRDLLERAAAALEADQKDAARYRWLSMDCRSSGEHWGGRWSIVIDGPAPDTYNYSGVSAAIDAALSTQGEKT